jgi:hypothetical protein
MSDQKIPVNRALVGILALACLTASGLIYWQYSHDDSWAMWQAAFLRVGVLMSTFWMALPSLGRGDAFARVSPGTLLAVFAGIIMIARLRIPVWLLLPICAFVALVALFLRPRDKKRPSRR